MDGIANWESKALLSRCTLTGGSHRTFTASHDVTILNVQLLSDVQQSEDFGHADLLTGYNAEYLVWQPILEWIKTHR